MIDFLIALFFALAAIIGAAFCFFIALDICLEIKFLIDEWKGSKK